MVISRNKLSHSILNETLQSFDYYVRKLPIFLRQSEGFIEHFRIWYDLLVGRKSDQLNNTGVVGSADVLFHLLNIFDQSMDDNGIITNYYLDYLNSLAEKERSSFESQADFEYYRDYTSDVLDKIGELFSITRSFEVTYEIDNETKTEQLFLNNHDFLILIKAQIVKNYCDGTYEQIKQYYESVGLYVYVTTSSEPATSNVYLAYFTSDNNYRASDNVQAMFFAGLLTIQSMGITYRHTYIDLDNLLIWDNDSQLHGWGDDSQTYPGGQWLI